MRKNKPLTTNKNKIIVGSSLLIVVLIAVSGFLYYRQHRQATSATTIQGSIPGEKIDLSPPTDEEKQQAEDNKSKLVERQEQESKPTEGVQKVTPFITDAGQYGQQIEVRAYISGVFESGGTCKAVFTKAGQTVTKEATGEKNVSNTICHALTINRSEFPSAGDWSLVLTYTSSTASGSSEPKTVKVN